MIPVNLVVLITCFHLWERHWRNASQSLIRDFQRLQHQSD
jgi:hypothetical protein